MRKKRKPTPAKLVINGEEIVFNQRDYPIMEKIVNAARNRVRVSITYQKDDAASVRVVAPYSFFCYDSESGLGLLYAEHDGQIKSFKLKQITNATLTTIPYSPKWPVKF